MNSETISKTDSAQGRPKTSFFFRPRFSIRWMLLVVAIFGCVLYYVRERRLFEEDARALYSCGWELEQLPDGVRLSGNIRMQYDPASWNISASQIARVAKWEDVVELSILGELQGSLSEFRGLSNLRRLRLGGCKVSLEGIESIGHLPNLEALALGEIGPDHLEPLQDAKCLTSLQLSHVSPGSLRWLPIIPRLKWLAFHCNRPQHDSMIAQLQYVAQCPQLEVLSISPAFVRGQELMVLQSAPKLQMMLIEPFVHPSVYDALAGISTLRIVCIASEFEESFYKPGELHGRLRQARPDIKFISPDQGLPGDPFAW